MTQEEKQLLLKDLCARLPHGVKAICEVSPNEIIDELRENNGRECFIDINSINGDKIEFRDEEGYVDWWMPLCYIRPYLRPMSSMTEEERKELRTLWYEDFAGDSSLSPETLGILAVFPCHHKTADFYLSQHFDYRGLIEKGLALEAPEGMYETK